MSTETRTNLLKSKQDNKSQVITGDKLFKCILQSAAIISTGSHELDLLLDGGVYTTELTELVGSVAAGKTQVCHMAMVNAIAKLKQNVVYIDTCGSFSCNRTEQMLSQACNECSVEDALMRLKVVKAFDIFELFAALYDLQNDLSSQTDDFYTKVKLIIVDSLPAVVAPLLGSSQQCEGLSRLAQIGLELKKMANDFKLAVLVTNYLVSSGDGNLKASMGRQWQHVPHTRVYLERDNSSGTHVASLLKSSKLQTSNRRVPFHIS